MRKKLMKEPHKKKGIDEALEDFFEAVNADYICSVVAIPKNAESQDDLSVARRVETNFFGGIGADSIFALLQMISIITFAKRNGLDADKLLEKISEMVKQVMNAKEE